MRIFYAYPGDPAHVGQIIEAASDEVKKLTLLFIHGGRITSSAAPSLTQFLTISLRVTLSHVTSRN